MIFCLRQNPQLQVAICLRLRAECATATKVSAPTV
jgi:hypothetical protein